MKPPAELDNYEQMEREVVSNLDIDEEELEAIMGRVFIESSYADSVHTDVEGFVDILITHAYREAAERDRKRCEYNSEKKVRRLREKKGGILKNTYPNANPDKWRARCEARFCRFESHISDSKVEEVICPVCSRELRIDPV